MIVMKILLHDSIIVKMEIQVLLLKIKILLLWKYKYSLLSGKNKSFYDLNVLLQILVLFLPLNKSCCYGNVSLDAMKIQLQLLW